MSKTFVIIILSYIIINSIVWIDGLFSHNFKIVFFYLLFYGILFTLISMYLVYLIEKIGINPKYSYEFYFAFLTIIELVYNIKKNQNAFELHFFNYLLHPPIGMLPLFLICLLRFKTIKNQMIHWR